jgi:hypothetical protein
MKSEHTIVSSHQWIPVVQEYGLMEVRTNAEKNIWTKENESKIGGENYSVRSV